MRKALIIIGPTAIGKTAVSIALAQKHQLPIISADSRQIYQELYIGVAKPSEEELSLVKHYEIGSVSIHQKSDVSLYCERVSEHLKTIDGNVIIVGGTGFYIKALIEGISELPKRNEELRKELALIFDAKGIAGLHEKYNTIKNPYLLKDMQNPQRLIRAIEMGEQLADNLKISFLKDFEFKIIGLETEREKLYQRINTRVDLMMEAGLEAEAKSLVEFKNLEALSTVGYSEMFDYFENKIDLPQAIDKIKQHTRNYAKRQLTYFKRQLNVEWFDMRELQKIDIFAQNFFL